MVIFVFILKMLYCVYSLESPQWEHTTYLYIEQIRKDTIIMPPDLTLWLILISSNYPSIFSPHSPSLREMARYRLKYCLKGPLNPKQPTDPVSNIFSWSLRCSSHWSSTVFREHLLYHFFSYKCWFYFRKGYIIFKSDKYLFRQTALWYIIRLR